MLRRVSTNTTPLSTVRTLGVAATSAASLYQTSRNWSYKPRMREYNFIFEEVFDMYKHYEKMGKSEVANKETVDALFEAAAQLCTDVMFPLYASGDKEGVTLKDGKVTTPKGFKEAYQQYVQGGWMGISFPEEYGGQGIPPSVGIFTREMLATANWAFGMYPGLSAGCAQTLIEHGTKEQKETYLTKVVSGQWAGTMCLTEPHCGTDLAQIKSVAKPNDDGSYKLTGTKIFISSGDHDLTENIIHIVLAKLPDAPSGTKGISLFIVPKFVF
jgi:alkylation response protein AidB-like acyl-CoA dehydrogenase